MRKILSALLFALSAPAAAQPPAADYECVYGCRRTDAPPRLEVVGPVARCWNEIGGLYIGEYNPPDGLSCFRKTGRILENGARIEWSDGVIWVRRPLCTFDV